MLLIQLCVINESQTINYFFPMILVINTIISM